MPAPRLQALARSCDLLCARSGDTVTARLVEPHDADALKRYYRSLSVRSRHNRFLGAMGELPDSLLDRFINVGRDDGFTVIASMMVDGAETLVGEMRYAFHAETGDVEFALSVADRWQRRGLGAALLKNLKCRAAALPAGCAFGDTLRTNAPMLGLARKEGYSLCSHPDDWTLVRLRKMIGVEPIIFPCTSLCLRDVARAHLA